MTPVAAYELISNKLSSGVKINNIITEESKTGRIDGSAVFLYAVPKTINTNDLPHAVDQLRMFDRVLLVLCGLHSLDIHDPDVERAAGIFLNMASCFVEPDMKSAQKRFLREESVGTTSAFTKERLREWNAFAEFQNNLKSAIHSVSFFMPNARKYSSSPQVILEYVEYLAGQYGPTVPQYELTNIVISADVLWTNCLDFTIITNDYASGEKQFTLKKETLRVVSRMDSLSRNAQNKNAALAVMEQISPISSLEYELGKPAPRPTSLHLRETISTNDTPAEVQRKTHLNDIAASNYAARVLVYNQDRAKRNYYKALRALNFFLKYFTNNFAVDNE